MAESSERRKYARIATDQMISIAPLDAGDVLAHGKDVSVGGIRFVVVGCELDLGETVRVTFNVGTDTVEAVGVVSWATEMDPLTTDIGLEFIDIDPEVLRLIEEGSEAIPSI